jgi:predicted PurR-regulated permease PerM
MEGHKLGRAPNFTGACIVMFGVNLAWILMLLLAVYGLVAAVFLCLVLNHWMTWLEQRRREEDRKYATTPTEANPPR